MPGSESGWVTFLSVAISLLLVVVTYLQFRIQSREFRPDLSVPKVAHYATVVKERETEVDEYDINGDEILFEVSNFGSGTATQVRVESKLWVLDQSKPNNGSNDVSEPDAEAGQDIEKEGCNSNSGGGNSNNKSMVSLSEFKIPRSLRLDVTREDVYHSDWTETMEEMIPGDQSNTGYVTRLHVRAEDRSLSLDEVLTHNFPEKSALRLQVQLVYTGRIEFRDRTSKLIDSVIFPGVCENLEEAMAAEIPYSRYERKSHTNAILDARADVEHHRQRVKNTDD